MEGRATAKYVRISPYKARRIVNLIRGKNVDDAIYLLSALPHKASRIVMKVLSSALSNLEQEARGRKGTIYVSEAYVDEGPILKPYRVHFSARGRVHRIRKRTSHITVVLSEEGRV